MLLGIVQVAPVEHVPGFCRLVVSVVLCSLVVFVVVVVFVVLVVLVLLVVLVVASSLSSSPSLMSSSSSSLSSSSFFVLVVPFVLVALVSLVFVLYVHVYNFLRCTLIFSLRNNILARQLLSWLSLQCGLLLLSSSWMLSCWRVGALYS